MAYSQAALISTGIIFPAIGFILVCCRFWMRLSLQKVYLGADDWLILVATILVIGVAFDTIYASFVGTMGMDGQPIQHSHEVPQKKLDYATLAFEKPAYGAIKLSVLLFYRRIFTLRKFRIVNNFLIALIVCWTVAYFFADVFSCGAHPEANWDPAAKAKTYCINLWVMLLTFAITDVLTDVAVLWMPYPEIKRLQMSSSDKWGLAGIFLLGTIDLIIGIVRLGFIIATQTVPAVNSNFINPPENTAPTFWTLLELGIGVIAANLPALAPAYRDRGFLLTSIRKKLSRSRGSSNQHTKTAYTHHDTKSTMPLDDGVPSNSGNAFGLRNEAKHKSTHIGMWDQFERLDSLDVAERGHTGNDRGHDEA